MKIGLWIQNQAGEELLVIRDPGGYPRLIPFKEKERYFEDPRLSLDLSPEEGRKIYQEVTGQPYPFGHATTRQVLWDLIEAALKHLP